MFTRHAMLCRITHNNKTHANASSLTINSYFSECCKKYIFSLWHRVYEKKPIEFSRTSGFSAFRDEWGKIHFRLFLSWLIDRYFNQWKCRLWGVRITWGVNCASHSCSKSPDFQRMKDFWFSTGFVWLAIEYVGKESESSKALTSSPIVRGITFLVFSARIFNWVVIVPCFIRPY